MKKALLVVALFFGGLLSVGVYQYLMVSSNQPSVFTNKVAGWVEENPTGWRQLTLKEVELRIGRGTRASFPSGFQKYCFQKDKRNFFFCFSSWGYNKWYYVYQVAAFEYTRFDWSVINEDSHSVWSAVQKSLEFSEKERVLKELGIGEPTD
jgi:hypothetical protein